MHGSVGAIFGDQLLQGAKAGSTQELHIFLFQWNMVCKGARLEVMACGILWSGSVTCSGTCKWVPSGVFSCPASEPPSFVGGSSLVKVLVGGQDSHP